MKCCNKCKVEKPLTEYHRDKTRKDGLSGVCKSCKKKQDKKRYDTLPDYYKGNVKENYTKNEEKYKGYWKERYKDNKEYYKQKHKEYLAIPENRERERERAREYSKKYYSEKIKHNKTIKR